MGAFLPARPVKNDHDLMKLVQLRNLAVTVVKDAVIVDIGSVLMNVETGIMKRSVKENVRNILETALPVMTALIEVN